MGLSPFRTPIPSALVAYHCQLLGILFVFWWFGAIFGATDRKVPPPWSLPPVVWGWSSWHSRNHECNWRNPKALKIWALAWEVAGNVWRYSIVIPLKWWFWDWWNQWGLFFQIFFHSSLCKVEGYFYTILASKKTPAWGPVLACVVCCRATWKSKWPQHSTSSPKVTVPAFLGEEIGARPLWWWLQCFFFASHKFQLLHYGIRMWCVYMLREPTSKGNNVGNGQEAARELISNNTYLPHSRVFWKGSWPILR